MGFFNNTLPPSGSPLQFPMLQQIGQLSNAMANPQQALLKMMTDQNPMMSQVLSMIGGKSNSQIQQAVQALCQQNGVDINQLMPQAKAIAQQFGIKV